MEVIEIRLPKKLTLKFLSIALVVIIVGLLVILILLYVLQFYFISINKVTFQSYIFDLGVLVISLLSLFYMLFRNFKKKVEIIK